MKKVILNIKNGEISLVTIPIPKISNGNVLVKTNKSLISIGTEKMLIDFGKSNYIKKALQQPKRVTQVLNKISTDGIFPTYDAIRNKLDDPIPLGYSNVGIVVESNESEFSVGDRVISNGSHSEYVSVPKNLTAKIPDNVDDVSASFTVLGSIGLQGTRLLEPKLGESVVVYGLGLIGLLSCQILEANGCNVIGIDIDSIKCNVAKKIGIKVIQSDEIESVISEVRQITNSYGADSILITAKTSSNDIIHASAEMCKKKGKIVLIGDIGLNLDRNDFYEKEISFQVSSSYGPGRYDPIYEQKNIDYPYAYVRWTAKRNFEAILKLMSQGKIKVKDLITNEYPIDKILEAYDNVKDPRTLGTIINYSSHEHHIEENKLLRIKQSNSENSQKNLSLGFVGTGAYAKRFLLPELKKKKLYLKTAVSKNGLSAMFAAKKFGFEFCSSNPMDIFLDKKINTVFIATHHNTHAKFVEKSIIEKKNIFVEKPLAINHKEIESIIKIINEDTRLMVGFNRRFSPLIKKTKTILAKTKSAFSIVYTINAGQVESSHWTVNKDIGGGRIIGEVCHFLDLVRYLADSEILNWNVINLGKIDDCISIQLKFKNGSIAIINYFTNGNNKYSKENIEIFNNGKIIKIDNFRKLFFYGYKREKNIKLWSQNKGQKECINAFIESINNNSPIPIPLNELIEVSKVAIDINDAI